MAGDDDGLQDWAADYDGEGQDRAERDRGDRGVVMMAAAKMVVAEDSGSGQQPAKVANNGNGPQGHVRLGGSIQRERLRAGSKQQWH